MDRRSGETGNDQRYFAGTLGGRFLTADPYEASGGASAPGSWNWYPYVGGDPVNHSDPRGLEPGGPVGCQVFGDAAPGCGSPGSDAEAEGEGQSGSCGTDGGGGTTAENISAKLFSDLNDAIRKGNLSNCGAFVKFAAKAVELTSWDSSAVSTAERLLNPTRSGGRGFNFASGESDGGGWLSD